jgi:hypothetical protein
LGPFISYEENEVLQHIKGRDLIYFIFSVELTEAPPQDTVPWLQNFLFIVTDIQTKYASAFVYRKFFLASLPFVSLQSQNRLA